MYTDMREEARDHARVRNAYFDQVSSQGQTMQRKWMGSLLGGLCSG